MSCPKCGSGDIEDGDYRFTADEILELNVECRKCGHIWIEIYTLKEIKE